MLTRVPGRSACSSRSRSGPRQRDAALGRFQSRPGDVHEHGAAAPGNARALVVVHHHDDVVEPVRPPHAARRWPDRDAGPDGCSCDLAARRTSRRMARSAHRQPRARPQQPVRPIEGLPQGERADRRRAVALPLAGLPPAAAQGARKAAGRRRSARPAVTWADRLFTTILGAACGRQLCVFIGASRRACYSHPQIKPTGAPAKDFADPGHTSAGAK